MTTSYPEMTNAKTRITTVKQISDSLPQGGECVVEIYGAELGRKLDLEGKKVSLGRDPQNTIIIDTDSVSRHHASIDRVKHDWHLIDLDSTNGTYLNDRIVTRCKLDSGDLIKVGDTIFKYLAGQNLEAAYHEEIYQMTINDGLTQIPNKRYMMDFLDKEFSRSKRYNRDLALLMFDIDHFKKVNDTYGHLSGDYVLKEIAHTISRRIRREELFARYGGEEFAIVLPESTPKGALDFGTILLNLVAEHTFEFEGNAIPVTVSIGVGHLTDAIKTPKSLIQIADQRLYEAKNGGRNMIVG